MTRRVSPSTTEDVLPAQGIYRQFRGMIVSGQLGPGEKLPTVRQAASDLGVAPGTVARAYKLLEADGLVVSRTAAGTRVAESAAALPAPVIRRIRELVEAGYDAELAVDDVVDVLRTTWLARGGADTAPAHEARTD